MGTSIANRAAPAIDECRGRTARAWPHGGGTRPEPEGPSAHVSSPWHVDCATVLLVSNGLTLLRDMREAQHGQVVVMMSTNSSVEAAVEAMRLGAYDYVREPITAVEFLGHVRRALATSTHRTDHARHGSRGLDAVVGESPSIGRVRELARRVAASDAATVLITGESGTGKDLVARTIHHEGRSRGPRRALLSRWSVIGARPAEDSGIIRKVRRENDLTGPAGRRTRGTARVVREKK